MPSGLAHNLDEFSYRPIKCLLDFRWEQTTWDFLSFPVVAYAFTAYSFSAAARIRAHAALQIFLPVNAFCHKVTF